MKKVGAFASIVLGMLTAFGPFVTDFYLAVMPEMANYFHTSPSLIALSLTTGMVGLAAGQLFIGPLTDKFGRKKILIASMALFALATVGCIVAPDVYTFNAMRVFQGIGGAGGIVISKSMATDMFTGKPLADFMALLQAINGVAPILAPVIGGTLTNFTTWQGVFLVLLALGVVLLVCCLRLRETLPAERRSQKSIIRTYANLFKVFRSRRFTLATLSNMFMSFAFFAYISSSPFIFQSVYGLSPFQFSLCFGLNAVMIGLGAAAATRFHHANTAMKWGAIDMMVSSVLIALCHYFHAPLAMLMPCYIYMLVCFGLMQPVSASIALDAAREHAGSASAVFGASLFVAGAVASPLVGLGDIMYSSAAVIAAGSLLCLAITLPLCAAIKQEGMARESSSEHRDM